MARVLAWGGFEIVCGEGAAEIEYEYSEPQVRAALVSIIYGLHFAEYKFPTEVKEEIRKGLDSFILEYEDTATLAEIYKESLEEYFLE